LILNSTKLYPCKKCGTEVLIRSKGLCSACRYKELHNHDEQKQGEASSDAEEGDPCLVVYFKAQLAILQRIRKSEESGLFISVPTKMNVCHLLPKGKYKSVKCNMENCIFLTGEEHARFDKLLFEHNFYLLEDEFPRGWPKAVNRLKKIIPLVTEQGRLLIALKEYLHEF